MVIGIVILAIVLVYSTIKHIFRFVAKHGLEIVIARLLIGRHSAGHYHTNATFWRDSDGRVIGQPRGRVSRRHHRAGWKNLTRSLIYTILTLGILYGVVMDWRITAYSTAGLLALIGCIGIARRIMRARTWFTNRGIIAPLSAALSSVPGVQDEEMEKSITLNRDYLNIKRGEIGRIVFPDRFHANEGEKREVEHLVRARFSVPVDVAWHTKKRPQYASIIAAPPLPPNGEIQ